MADQLTEQQQAEYRETFDLFDKDKNGYIESKELGEMMKQLGMRPTAQELTDMINEVDANGDGKVDFKEFLLMIAKRPETKSDVEDDLMESFRVFDENGDGFISIDELRHVMTSVGEKLSSQELDEMIKEADEDGDGRINYKEFANMVMAKN